MTSRNIKMRHLSRFMIYFLAIGVAAYAAVAYSLLPLGALVHPDMKIAFQTHSAAIYTHIFASIAALALGPFQFFTQGRAKYARLHRLSGRVYLLVGVLLGGSAGLYMAQFAFGGLIARVGFTVLALAWLSTGFMAYRAIRRRDIQNHRRWMIRNFALTLAAVSLRIYLPLGLVAGFKFEDIYPLIAWLCWIPNLLIAEWILVSRSKIANIPHATDV